MSGDIDCWFCVWLQAIPRQVDSYNCGVFVCWYATMLVERGYVPRIAPNMNGLREEIKAYLEAEVEVRP